MQANFDIDTDRPGMELDKPEGFVALTSLYASINPPPDNGCPLVVSPRIQEKLRSLPRTGEQGTVIFQSVEMACWSALQIGAASGGDMRTVPTLELHEMEGTTLKRKVSITMRLSGQGPDGRDLEGAAIAVSEEGEFPDGR